MPVFQNKNLFKAFLEKKNQGTKSGGKFRIRQKTLWPRNRYQKLVLVSVADMEVAHTNKSYLFFWLKSYENGQELDKTHQCAACC